MLSRSNTNQHDLTALAPRLLGLCSNVLSGTSSNFSARFLQTSQTGDQSLLWLLVDGSQGDYLILFMAQKQAQPATQLLDESGVFVFQFLGRPGVAFQKTSKCEYDNQARTFRIHQISGLRGHDPGTCFILVLWNNESDCHTEWPDVTWRLQDYRQGYCYERGYLEVCLCSLKLSSPVTCFAFARLGILVGRHVWWVTSKQTLSNILKNSKLNRVNEVIKPAKLDHRGNILSPGALAVATGWHFLFYWSISGSQQKMGWFDIEATKQLEDVKNM